MEHTTIELDRLQGEIYDRKPHANNFVVSRDLTYNGVKYDNLYQLLQVYNSKFKGWLKLYRREMEDIYTDPVVMKFFNQVSISKLILTKKQMDSLHSFTKTRYDYIAYDKFSKLTRRYNGLKKELSLYIIPGIVDIVLSYTVME